MKDIGEIRRMNALSLIGSNFNGKKSRLAEALGIQPSYVSRMLVSGSKGERGVGDEMARRIEEVAGKPRNWLDQDHEHLPSAEAKNPLTTVLRPAMPTRGRVPVVSWVIAGEWADIDDPQQIPVEDYEYIETIEQLDAGNAIALRVEGTSMYDGTPGSFEPGCFIVVKSVHLREPKSGDFVVVRLENEKRATFKQLIQDGDSVYLKPLNPALPVMRVNGEATIVGVVVEKVVRTRF